MQMIDSADAVANQVALAAAPENTPSSLSSAANPIIRFSATDSLEKFRDLGERFLAHPIQNVELVTLPE
jgi:hypothetical protein